MISSASGKRPASRFEKTTLPSATTSNCPWPPETISASWGVLSLTSAARLAARRS
ncbi:MAG TPA: hypothetical protein VFU26_11630 [Gaiellaceae bacterium]|nr:hypothetical protein [Gaiellaceae bacterium]